MIIFKHVEYQIKDREELDDLRSHLIKTTSLVDGVALDRILISSGRDKFVLVLDCESEATYQEWREICPPPAGARDWYEVFLTDHEAYPDQQG